MSYSDQFFKNLFGLFKCEKFTDFTISVSGKEIHVHKVILASSSKYFAAMFSSKFKEAATNRLEIEGFTFSIIEALIIYIYSRSTSHITPIKKLAKFDEKDIKNYACLLRAADMYQIDSLRSFCEDNLCDAVRDDSANCLMSLAITYNLEKLRQIVARHIAGPGIQRYGRILVID